MVFTGYTTYFQFFTDIQGIIHDTAIDFKLSGLNGADFDAAYLHFIQRLTQRCKNFIEASFHTHSPFISKYISEMKTTVTYPQCDRFSRLEEVTTCYIRKSA